MDEQSTSGMKNQISFRTNMGWEGRGKLHCAELKYSYTEGIHNIVQCLVANVLQTELLTDISDGSKQQNHFQVVWYQYK